MMTRSKTTQSNPNPFRTFMNMEEEQLIEPIVRDSSLQKRLKRCNDSIYIGIDGDTDIEKYIDAFSCVYPSFVWRKCKPRNGKEYIVGFPCDN